MSSYYPGMNGKGSTGKFAISDCSNAVVDAGGDGEELQFSGAWE
jgi:hypothetical protein